MTRGLLIFAASLLLPLQAEAQTMYRCGSVYQDRPCDAGQKGRAVGSTGTSEAAAPQASGVDAECAQRGRNSNRIVWAREGGATQERLLSEASSQAERRLIHDVYRRAGAASTVQAAVEADCVAEKQREEQDAAIAIAAALKARREGAGGVAQPSAAQPVGDDAAQERQAKLAAREAEHKKRQCTRYNDQMEGLRRQERTGGSAARMDSLNEQRRNLRESMSRAGC